MARHQPQQALRTPPRVTRRQRPCFPRREACGKHAAMLPATGQSGWRPCFPRRVNAHRFDTKPGAHLMTATPRRSTKPSSSRGISRACDACSCSRVGRLAAQQRDRAACVLRRRRVRRAAHHGRPQPCVRDSQRHPGDCLRRGPWRYPPSAGQHNCAWALPWRHRGRQLLVWAVGQRLGGVLWPTAGRNERPVDAVAGRWHRWARACGVP